jgi:RluA family pseudouridine synthase
VEPPKGRTVEFQIDLGDRGLRMDLFISRRVRSLARTLIQRLIRDGHVTVDGTVVRRVAHRLKLPYGKVPTRLVLFVPQAEDEEPLSLEGRVLYQDADLLVVDKPSGYPVVARLARAGEDVVRAARRHLGDPEAFVGTPHRIDAGTSGVVVLALTREAGRALAETFAQRRARKTYLGWVATPPDPRAGVVDRAILAPGDGSLPRLDPTGKPASTRYRTLGPDGDAWRVLLRPLSGRTHQIRLHLASLNRPLLGDQAHGGPEAARLWLHALSLSLPHPRTGARVRLRASPPSPSGPAGVALPGSADHNCQLPSEELP